MRVQGTPAAEELLQSGLVMVACALYVGLVVGMGFLASARPDRPPQYGSMFVATWGLVPILTVVLAGALILIRRRLLRDHPAFYPAVLVAAAIVPLGASPLLLPYTHAIIYLPRLSDLRVLGGLVSLPMLVGAQLLLVPTLIALAAVDMARRGAWWGRPDVLRRLTRAAYVLTPLSIALAFVHFSPGRPGLNWPTATAEERLSLFAAGLGLAGLAAVGVWVAGRAQVPALLGRLSDSRLWRYAFVTVVLATIAFVTLDIALPVDRFHQYSFLVPIHAIALGRTPLIDVSSGNGVFAVFAYSWVFQWLSLPHTAQALTFVNSFFVIAEFIGLFFLLRIVTGSLVVGALGVGAIIWVHFLSAAMPINWYTQHGPSRFGMPFFFLLASALRGAYPRHARAFLLLEHAILGLASIWKLEAFAYTAIAYAASTLYEAYARSETPLRFVLFQLRRAVLAVAVIALAHSGFAALVMARSGQWPDWPQYFVVFSTIVPGGQDSLWAGRQIPFWTPWALFEATLGLSFLAIVWRLLQYRRQGASHADRVIFGMTACGIPQFYFHLLITFPYSLHPVAIPAVFVGVCWGYRLWLARDRLPAAFWAPAMVCFAWGAAIVGLATWPQAAIGLGRARPVETTVIAASALIGRPSWTLDQFTKRLQGAPSTDDVYEALDLIQKYRRPDETRLGVFLFDGIATSEVLMLSGALHAFPMDYPTQDALHAIWRRRAIEADHGLSVGDVVYVDPATENYLHRRIVRRLCGEFVLEPLEVSSKGVTALRLGAPDVRNWGPWCIRNFAPFVAAPDGQVYAMSQGQRREIPSDGTFAVLAGPNPDPAHVVNLTEEELDDLPVGPPIPSANDKQLIARIDSRDYYLLEANGVIRRVPDENSLKRYLGASRPDRVDLDELDLSSVLVVTDGDERFWASDPIQLQLEVRPGREHPQDGGDTYGLDAVLLPNVPDAPRLQ